MLDTLMRAENVEAHLSRWELAVFASDLHLFLVDDEEGGTPFTPLLLEQGKTEQEAWLLVTGSVMPAAVQSHWAVRKRMSRQLAKPKHAARTLHRWLMNYRQLKQKPYTSMQLLSQRLQAFALVVPPDEIASLAPQATTWDTVVHMIDVFQQDWATAASVTVLLHLMRAMQTEKPAFVGSLTPVPSTWPTIPTLTRVYTDQPLPRSEGVNRYAVLFQTRQAVSVAIVSSHIGQECEWRVPLRRQHEPKWVMKRGDGVGVGSQGAVTVVEGGVASEWRTDEQPQTRVMTKLDNMLVWAEKGELHGLTLSSMQLVADTSEVQRRLLDDARTAVCACVDKNIVFCNGAVLFRLPPLVEQRVVAVQRSSVQLVDVFTSVGDWWRVNVDTLEAVVVGLDLPRGAQIVDVCVYESSI